MLHTRKPFHFQQEETARGQLDKLWRGTMSLAPVLCSGEQVSRVVDDEKGEIHELACQWKAWADHEHGMTGVYPDAQVLALIRSNSLPTIE
jgi:hypothetical protein